ncbi:hypothetical protein WJ0W_001416 [Paenibacillus melissococcoides]|uniref:Uncharacterized protein n=1 Tax=Paenibacillus melissococcoides TaxID=2912268 RepID=A0ABM9FY63_9BACL|nr:MULTISPECIES: hypothetical protein [Paenibacillus]MEB9893676.1 hypothetical protein [Bacillus cereus]CAH8244178.1 hypothetical protein WJ0W_001416 [Paenibacillus melissococcoides]CAH8703713.1 hypothetical protein HTL2_000247 [Paenibacillus melissococcoides]CAH8706224.1 hypothetical protein WDD9_001209 [Paenibacillus melissococcoides]GIO77764.1 hypothetical protein J6TS7_13740 [Paenibacillus dendritiformis]
MNPLMTRIVLFLLIISFFPVHNPAVYAARKPQSTVVISVRTTPSATFEQMTVLNPKEAAQLLEASREEEASRPDALTDIYVLISRNGQARAFRMEKPGVLWSETESKRLILSPKAARRMQKYGAELKERHYGATIPWSEAKQLIPRKSTFSIIDLEKGLSFRVQRRAGSRHADVQPLTKEDTKIMKQIYDNQWSWKRKAILVVTDKHKIAASMNGMPHGGDGIPGNGFAGHFCVHFLDSSTHRSANPDIFHQLMVYTASGQRETFLHTASPAMLAEIFIGALSVQDHDLLKSVSKGLEPEAADYLFQEMESGTTFRLTTKNKRNDKTRNTELDTVDSLMAEVTHSVSWRRKNQAEKSAVFRFEFARDSLHSPWKISSVKSNMSPRR